MFWSKNKKNRYTPAYPSFAIYKGVYIARTCFPDGVYPLKLNFYIEKLGFSMAYLIFLYLLQNIDCRYSFEPPRRGGSPTCTQNVCFERKFELKIQLNFSSEKISVYCMGKFS